MLDTLTIGKPRLSAAFHLAKHLRIFGVRFIQALLRANIAVIRAVLVGYHAAEKAWQHFGADIDDRLAQSHHKSDYRRLEDVDRAVCPRSRRVGDFLVKADNEAVRVLLDDAARLRRVGLEGHQRDHRLWWACVVTGDEGSDVEPGEIIRMRHQKSPAAEIVPVGQYRAA